MKSKNINHQNKYQSIFSKRQTNNTLRQNLPLFVQNNDFYNKKNQTHHYNSSLTSNNNFLNVLKKTHLNTSSSFLDTNRISSKQSSNIQYDDDFENIEPSQLVEKLKETIHGLKKKQASKRLEISKLKTQIQQYSEEIQKLKQSFKNYEIKATKDNEYILKLDIEFRNTKQELLKMKKNITKSDKLKQLQNQNEEMRFVISELLLQLQNIKNQKQNSSKQEFQKLQNIHQLMKDITLNNSSVNSRRSSLNALEFTMNPQSESFSIKKNVAEHLSYPNLKAQNMLLKRNPLEIVRQQSESSKIYLQSEHHTPNQPISNFLTKQSYDNGFHRYNSSFQQYQQ